MEHKATSKHIKKFECEVCLFNCVKKGDYNRHLVTAIHKRNTNGPEKTSNHIKSYSCSCGKVYKVKSGLWKHKQNCSHNNEITVNKNETPSVLEILSQNKELMNLLIVQNQEHREETSKLQNTILELAPKIGNNNNNTTNNTQFNLQVFLNEECKDALNFSDFVETIKVSFGDLENQAEN